MRKKKITGFALLIIGLSLFLIKTGFSVIFIKPISKLTGLAILEKVQSINSTSFYIAALFLIATGFILLILEKKEVKLEVKIVEEKLRKFEGK